MEQKTLVGKMRATGKSVNRSLRRNGEIPCVIYGHNEPVSVAISAQEFNTKFKVVSENVIIKLAVDKNSYDVLVKDFQEDIITGKVMHIDFFEIEKGKVLKTNVPFHPTGSPVGVREGGLFEILVHEIEVECLPANIPDQITIDVAELKIGQSIHVKDLPQFENVKYLISSDQVVCVVTRKKEAKEEAKPAEGEAAATEEGKTAESAEGSDKKSEKKE